MRMAVVGILAISYLVVVWQFAWAQVTRDKAQTKKKRPAYVFVVAPPSELAKGIPNTVQLPPLGRDQYLYHQLRMRCTESECPLRACPAVLGVACPDPTEEIHADDRDVDLLQGDELDAASEGDDSEVLGSTAVSSTPKRDYVIDLWPYAHPLSYYENIF